MPLIAALFCVWALISSIWSPNSMLSFGRAGTLILLLYIAALLTIHARHSFSNPVAAVTSSTLIAMLTGLALLFLISFLIWDTPFKFGASNTYTGRQGRLILAHGGPLDTGEYMALVTVVAALVLRQYAAKVLITGTLIILILLTDSRNLLVCVPIALAAAWFHRGSSTLRFLVTALFVFGIAVVLILLVSGDLMRLLPHDLRTLNGRIPLWQFAGRTISEHPLLGVGYYASRYYLTARFYWAGQTHNAYVETLMTTGLIGLALLLVFLASCAKVSFQSRNALLTGILVLTCLASIFSPLLMSSNLYTFLLFVMAILVGESLAAQRIQFQGHQ
ncbi:MAG: O-antigen ligase family protein [Woeseia sp.]|nr:O-antigen ligase family protein [Woeseia sp.]